MTSASETRFEIGTTLELFFLTEEEADGTLWFVHGVRKDGKCRQAHRVMVENDDYPPDVMQAITRQLNWQNHIMSRQKCYNPNDLSDRMKELEKYDR